MDKIGEFLSLLTASPPWRDVFNPWRDVDGENDRGPEAPEIRRSQLRHYLETRLERAGCLLIGEAVGYQGGHFSGIPMTSERILLGHQTDHGVHPEHVLPNLRPRRTSKPEINPKGFSEPTATIVWQTILNAGCDPQRVVLWNVFPWHPFDSGKGILSNRKPRAAELAGTLDRVEAFLALYPLARVVAMGKVAEEQLQKLKVNCQAVRHPAQGGASRFRDQFRSLPPIASRSLPRIPLLQ